MKILVTSDSHGSYEALLDSIIYEEFDMLVHLGDYVEDGEKICEYLSLPSLIVAGNGDYGSIYKDEELLEIGGKKIFLTHGHLYNVRKGIDSLYYRAMEEEADLVLFGHTHVAVNHVENGLIFMNPGSPSFPRNHFYQNKKRKPSYGVITIGYEIKSEIIEI